jgi:hypothetical protein
MQKMEAHLVCGNVKRLLRAVSPAVRSGSLSRPFAGQTLPSDSPCSSLLLRLLRELDLVLVPRLGTNSLLLINVAQAHRDCRDCIVSVSNPAQIRKVGLGV